jgi:hypothetical protein
MSDVHALFQPKEVKPVVVCIDVEEAIYLRRDDKTSEHISLGTAVYGHRFSRLSFTKRAQEKVDRAKHLLEWLGTIECRIEPKR